MRSIALATTALALLVPFAAAGGHDGSPTLEVEAHQVGVELGEYCWLTVVCVPDASQMDRTIVLSAYAEYDWCGGIGVGTTWRNAHHISSEGQGSSTCTWRTADEYGDVLYTSNWDGSTFARTRLDYPLLGECEDGLQRAFGQTIFDGRVQGDEYYVTAIIDGHIPC